MANSRERQVFPGTRIVIDRSSTNYRRRLYSSLCVCRDCLEELMLSVCLWCQCHRHYHLTARLGAVSVVAGVDVVVVVAVRNLCKRLFLLYMRARRSRGRILLPLWSRCFLQFNVCCVYSSLGPNSYSSVDKKTTGLSQGRPGFVHEPSSFFVETREAYLTWDASFSFT